jgi:hypothetical protein
MLIDKQAIISELESRGERRSRRLTQAVTTYGPLTAARPPHSLSRETISRWKYWKLATSPGLHALDRPCGEPVAEVESGQEGATF